MTQAIVEGNQATLARITKMTDILYLVVLYDRHVSDQYGLFSSFDAAQEWCVKFMRSYGKRYVWSEWKTNAYEWARVTDVDDGPRCHIENIVLDNNDGDGFGDNS